MYQLLEAGVNPMVLSSIFYTHLHCDHTAELIPLLFTLKNSVEALRRKDLYIFGPPGFKEFYHALMQIYSKWVVSQFYRVISQEVSSEPIEFGTWHCQAKPMTHSTPSVGYRFEDAEGKTLVYSGDTDYCSEIVELAHRVDLLILECSFPDEKRVAGHLTPGLAGRIAQEAQCKKLVLTHFYPLCDQYNILEQCHHTFSGEVVLAYDLMHLSV
jgi:ribonuclease BN (tRNA processing enzyme)